MEYLLYRSLLYVHILSAIVSIGPFFILFPVLKKLKLTTQTEQINAYLDTFRFAVYFAKHSGHILVGSGILLVLAGPWTWTTPWIVITLLILLGSLVFLARAFSPTLRKFQEGVIGKETMILKLSQAVWIYLILLLIMLWFMVGKPMLW